MPSRVKAFLVSTTLAVGVVLGGLAITNAEPAHECADWRAATTQQANQLDAAWSARGFAAHRGEFMLLFSKSCGG